jgi:8-amino-7-oxononanoate synthase
MTGDGAGNSQRGAGLESCREPALAPGQDPGDGPLARLRDAAAARQAAGLRRALRPRTPDHGGLLDLASNDYLGLSRDPRLASAAAAAAHEWGTGSTGSRLVTGSTSLHAELEIALAEFASAQAALVFSSGYMANLAAVTALTAALARPGPAARQAPAAAQGTPAAAQGTPAAAQGTPAAALVVSDAANHASLIDACRLSRHARVAVTPHADLNAVRSTLAAREEEAAIVVTDAVFSVDGDAAPLAGLHRIARQHGAVLLVDEAHSFGVTGPGGRGAIHAAGLAAEPDVVRTVTLSKALGGQGGAVLGPAEVIGTLVDTGRSFIFDTGLAPPSAGSALAALGVLAAEPGLAQRARANAAAIARIAAGLGLPVTHPAAAVVCIILGSPGAAIAAQQRCVEHGVHVGCFRPPSVPAGRCCLRLTARADLTGADLAVVERALTAIAPRGFCGRMEQTE